MEPDKVVVTAIVLSDEATLISYIVEDVERSDCFTIGSEDSDIKEIDKVGVKSILKELADLKRKETDCIDKLAQAVPEMRGNEVVVISEKMPGMDLPKYVYEMYERIHSPHNFRAALAAGEWLLSLYKHNKAGTDVVTVPDLCTFFDVRKTKLYEIPRGEKYGKEKEAEKKPLKRIKLEPVKIEKFRKNHLPRCQRKAVRSQPRKHLHPRRSSQPRPPPPPNPKFFLRTNTIRSFPGPPHPPKEKILEKLN